MNLLTIDITQTIESKMDRSKWQKWKISDLVENINEKVTPKDSGLEHYIGLEHLDSGSLHIRRFGETANLAGDKLKIYKGDLIFAKRNAYLKRVAVAKFDAVASAHSLVLRAKPENVHPDFLPFFMLSEQFWERAIEISVGSLSPTINWRVLAKQEFLLPPRELQVEIFELFKSMDEVIENESNVSRKLEVLRDTNREKLYTYGIDALHKPNESSLKLEKCGLIRNDIKVARFFDVVEIKSGQVDPKKDEFSSLIQIGSERIEPNTGRITEYKSAKELDITSGNYLFTESDIIYSKIRPYFKKVANPNMQGLCSADIYPLRPKDESLNKDFLFYYLLTEKFTRRLLRFQNRTGMPKVNRDELGSMHIPIPSLDEQNAIVEILSNIDQVLIDQRLQWEQSRALQKSLINQVF